MEIKKNNARVMIIYFNPARFARVQSQDLDFQHHMSWSFLMFNEFRGEVIVRFVDIGGIVDHHYLKVFFF
jgi:hypothetical protein